MAAKDRKFSQMAPALRHTPMDELEAPLEDIEELRDALAARDAPSEPWESVKAELGLK